MIYPTWVGTKQYIYPTWLGFVVVRVLAVWRFVKPYIEAALASARVYSSGIAAPRANFILGQTGGAAVLSGTGVAVALSSTEASTVISAAASAPQLEGSTVSVMLGQDTE